MNKKWLFAGIGSILVLGGATAALWPQVAALAGLSRDAKSAQAATLADICKNAKDNKDGKENRDCKDGKPIPPLEFSTTEVVQPSMVTMSQSIEFSGPLVAPNSALVRAKASGTLLALNAAEGSRVSAGQNLGRIDQAELGSRIAERQAAVESARAALVQAERAHASNERLAAQSFISPIALENSRATMDTAKAQVNQALASLESTRVVGRDAALVAPISGIVSKRHVVPGEKVSMEQQIATIVDLRKLELAGTVGTHEVGRLAPGMGVQVRIEGVDKPVDGRLARIAPAAEAGTRSIGVTVEIDNPRETLRAGQYALAQVTLLDERKRLSVPATAVGNTSGQDHVWVIAEGLLTRRSVTLGRRDAREGRVEVLQGLTAGSQVLMARFDNLREGAKALVVAGKASPVASAAASTPTLK